MSLTSDESLRIFEGIKSIGEFVVIGDRYDVTSDHLQVYWTEFQHRKAAWNARKLQPGPLADASAQCRNFEHQYNEVNEVWESILKRGQFLKKSVKSLKRQIYNCDRWHNPLFVAKFCTLTVIAILFFAACVGLAYKPSFGVLIGFIFLCISIPSFIFGIKALRENGQKKRIILVDKLIGVEIERIVLQKEFDSTDLQLELARQLWDNANKHRDFLLQSDPTRIAYLNARQMYEDTRKILKSERWKLLHSDWRSLRGVPLERFLKRVFIVLGYRVELTKASGDQGIDLILVGAGTRIGIQVKGYSGSVGNDSVQQAFAGKVFYNCERCAVITNSYFTPSAKDLAKKVGCRLVDGNRLPELIKGILVL